MEEESKWRALYLKLSGNLRHVLSKLKTPYVIDDETEFVYVKASTKQYRYILESLKC